MAVHDFRSQRLFIENDLREGVPVDASREQANYLLNVLRLTNGSQILVFNGRDGEWLVDIQVLGRKKCSIVPVKQIRSQPDPPSLVYCFAPLKQARLDYMVQKAVEMGVGTLQPIITQHTQVRTVNTKRMKSNAIEAAEQCGVLSIPEVREPVGLSAFLTEVEESTQLVFCDEASPRADIQSELQELKGGELMLLIGPEGGFSDDERSLIMENRRTYKLGLGPRILRADTAAVAALTILQALAGDWYNEA